MKVSNIVTNGRKVKDKNKELAQNVLIAARWLISDKKAWLQNCLAEDKYGVTVSVLDDDACKFCSIGAVLAFENTEYLPLSNIGFTIRNALSESMQDSILNFNDADGRKHKEVLEAFDRAIASLEQL